MPSIPQALRIDADFLWDKVLNSRGKNGLLCYAVHSVSGKILDQRSAIQDFGDYVQYGYWAGKLLARQDLCDWSIGQVLRGVELYQQPEGFFLAARDTDELYRHRPWMDYFRLEDNSDLLMGMASLYRLSGDERLRQPIERLFDFIQSTAPHTGTSAGNVFLVHKLGAVRLPFRLPDGLFAEEAVLWSQQPGCGDRLQLAKSLLEQWDENRLLSRRGIYPIKSCTWGPQVEDLTSLLFNYVRQRPGRQGNYWKFKSAYMIKSNTNMISGAIAYSLLRPEDQAVSNIILRWTRFILENCQRDDGYFYGVWDGVKNEASHSSWPLADNHHILNIFLDAYHLTREASLLESATRNGRFWLAATTEIGLKPELYRPGAENLAILDMQVDYLIALLKLFEITRDRVWLDHVLFCTKQIRHLFMAPEGLHWSLDASRGTPEGSGKICTKFLGLYTKLLFLTQFVADGASIYEDRTLFDLSRDR